MSERPDHAAAPRPEQAPIGVVADTTQSRGHTAISWKLILHTGQVLRRV